MVSFLIFFIGFMFVYRMMKICLIEKKISHSIMLKTFTTLVSMNLMFCFLTVWISDFWVLFFQFLQIFLFYFLEPALNLILRQKFKSKLIFFFDEVLLMMTTGRSFRDSLLYFCNSNDDFFSKKLLEIYTSTQSNEAFNNIKGQKEFYRLWTFFKSLEANQNKLIEKVRNYRRSLFWSQNFKKKSSQAKQQIIIQVGILIILYIGLIIFTFKTTSAHFLKWFLISFILFSTGLLSLYIISRKKIWKT